MKKLFYFSFAIALLSLTSCRDQEDMVQMNTERPSVNNVSASTDNGTVYIPFNADNAQQGDPARPPQD